jgi:hypothetical protein
MVIVAHVGQTSNGRHYSSENLTQIALLAHSSLLLKEDINSIDAVIGIVTQVEKDGDVLRLQPTFFKSAPDVSGKYLTPSFLADLFADGSMEIVSDLRWILSPNSAFPRAEKL